MSRRFALLLAALLVGLVLLLVIRQRERLLGGGGLAASRATAPRESSSSAPEPAGDAGRYERATAPREAVLSAAPAPEEFPLAAPLNAPAGTIARDLDALAQILDAWRTNFPGQGNPVGENSEIAAALSGDNPAHLVLIPRNHRAFNDRGELCDRWGTPFRFHQLSGEHMDLRSAGPDRKFGTADDAVWSSGLAK
jgi:hypothetical protein